MTDPAQPTSKPRLLVEREVLYRWEVVSHLDVMHLTVSPAIDDQFSLGGVFSSDLIEVKPAERVVDWEVGSTRKVQLRAWTSAWRKRHKFFYFTHGEEWTRP